MSEVVEAINSLSDKVSSPNASDWIMIAITVAYVFATALICYFNKHSADAARKQIEESQNQLKESQKQLAESQKQHSQNVGIQLYSIRKDFLKRFSEKKYDDIFWDASILFSERISDQVIGTGTLYESYRRAQADLELYVDRMKQDDPELYEQYSQKSNEDELKDLCEHYSPIVNDGFDETPRMLVHSTIVDNIDKLSHEYEAMHTKTFLSIKQEIKKSIQYGGSEDAKS